VLTNLEYGKPGIVDRAEAGVEQSIFIWGNLGSLKAHTVALKKISNAIGLRTLHFTE
jgi:hypothetical protein